jgi:hypothetical protein
MESTESEAEAALEALRAAIGQPTSPSLPPIDSIPELITPLPHTPSLGPGVDSTVGTLAEINQVNLGILEGLDSSSIDGNEGLRVLVDNCRRQYEIVKELTENVSDLGELLYIYLQVNNE